MDDEPALKTLQNIQPYCEMSDDTFFREVVFIFDFNLALIKPKQQWAPCEVSLIILLYLPYVQYVRVNLRIRILGSRAMIS